MDLNYQCHAHNRQTKNRVTCSFNISLDGRTLNPTLLSHLHPHLLDSVTYDARNCSKVLYSLNHTLRISFPFFERDQFHSHYSLSILAFECHLKKQSYRCFSLFDYLFFIS